MVGSSSALIGYMIRIPIRTIRLPIHPFLPPRKMGKPTENPPQNKAAQPMAFCHSMTGNRSWGRECLGISDRLGQRMVFA